MSSLATAVGRVVGRRGWRLPGGSAGTVTAEMAVALPSLVIVLFMALTGVAAATAQLRCVDAAREGARMAARGDPAGQVRDASLQVAPAGSTVVVSAAGGRVTVTVRGRARPLGSWLPGLPVSGRAVAGVESHGPP